ncbi:hypothetical protein PLICRDRAFT_46916 [Plicaturopsis crispa FD-325 SS-3]|uniref:Enoyl reductase (ER) domain-containing protein n=1 Tax=Plicaturopsis crispa FD-325 SS-3 TaxID=944288 RepID=A0A0C9SQG8_PLICR|nr:hypothetical protein PLICRDRAFT_46916 [Plicaturopsis crispa FD-325 SS-3]
MSTTTLPQKQKGVWFDPSGCSFREFDVTPPGPGEVLIKNVAVASNPKDWKYTRVWYDLVKWEGIEGNDVAGYVEAVGEGVTEFKKGDRVAAFTKMTQPHPKWGAYQQYSTAPLSTTFPLGARTAFEDAATLPLALGTAFIGLYRTLAIPPFITGDTKEKDKVKGKPILIYGASSSVGAYTVQLAKLSGLYVVGVAGSSAEYARSLGADVVVDYRGKTPEQISAEITKAVEGHGALHLVYDAVSTQSTRLIELELLGKAGGGKLCSVLPWPEELKVPVGVEAVWTKCSATYEEDTEFAAKMYRALSPLVDSGLFKPNRVRIIPGGLAGVPKGVEMLGREEVSGEKLVYLVGDTPGL